MKRFKSILVVGLFLLIGLAVLSPEISPHQIPTWVLAQSTAEGQVWRARLVDVVPNAILGGGAIVRVHVQDRPGALIQAQLEEVIIENTAGSKAEYGPHAAEFAPLQPGQWVFSVPSIGATFALETDDTSIFVIEFFQVSSGEATAQAQGSVTPTPRGGLRWEGRETGRVAGPSIAGALLIVTVEDQAGVPVDISTFTDFIGQGVTGSKVDLPSDEVEFAGLAPGRYIITPHGFNTEYIVDLDVNSTTYIEFFPITPPTATPTATSAPPTWTPGPTNTPLPTPTPTPTATPLKQWQAVIEKREAVDQILPKLIVKVTNRSDERISVPTNDPNTEITCVTGRMQGYGQDECEILGLLPGIHTITWGQENLSIPVDLKSGQLTVLTFTQTNVRSLDPVWEALVVRNDNQPIPTDQSLSKLGIKLADGMGQIISVRSSKGEQLLCETDASGYCQFRDLTSGVYTIEPASISTRFALFLDGLGLAQVNFEEQVRASVAEVISAVPISGIGARPRVIPTATPTVTSTPTATVASSQPQVTNSTPTVPPTATPIPTATATATPAQGWIGVVIEDYEHAGQTIVVNAPLGDHPIVLKSGGWQTEGRTGSKPELGAGAVEFSGLAPGKYTVVLTNLGETQVTLGSNRFVKVQFAFGPLPTPTPTARPGQWTAAVISNTSSNQVGSGAWSILTIQVGGYNNLPVRVSTDGFETECITGTKPELGDGVCQMGGLWSGTYHLEPAGLPISIDVTLDGNGQAEVAFWQQ